MICRWPESGKSWGSLGLLQRKSWARSRNQLPKSAEGLLAAELQLQHTERHQLSTTPTPTAPNTASSPAWETLEVITHVRNRTNSEVRFAAQTLCVAALPCGVWWGPRSILFLRLFFLYKCHKENRGATPRRKWGPAGGQVHVLLQRIWGEQLISREWPQAEEAKLLQSSAVRTLRIKREEWGGMQFP